MALDTAVASAPKGAVAAALCTSLVGLGIARFAYAPIIPALIAAHWFSPGQAAYLGAANIVGYLGGAWAARPVAARLGVRATLRTCLVLATASLLVCAVRAGFGWFVAWRLVSGLAGAGLTVLAAPSVLPLVAPQHRGRAGGLIFTGIGIGIAASGTLLPVLLHHGPPAAWLALGLTSLALTAFAWRLLPPDAGGHPAGSARSRTSPALRALNLAYALSAMGQVPAILFLADFVARGRGLGVASGGAVWALFGVGALIGPIGFGVLSDRIGGVGALRALWVSQVVAFCALAGLAASGMGGLGSIGLAAGVVGAGVPGLVVLVLGRSQVLAGPDEAARGAAWARATLFFAFGQAVAAYAESLLFDHGQRYDLLFAAGALSMAAAILVGEASHRQALGAARLTRPVAAGGEAR